MRKAPIRIGLEMNGEGLPIREIIRFGIEAENAGFDSVWHAENQRDPWVPLSVIAAETKNIRVAAGLAIWARSPAMLEHVAANLDELSEQRFVLGIGTAPREWNENWHGISYERPAERMREYVEIIRGMWEAHSGKTFSYDGERFTIRDYHRALRPVRERIPIYLGAVRRNMVELSGAVADGVLFNVLTTPRYLREYALEYLAAGAARANRSVGDIERATVVLTAVNSDPTEARRMARHQIAYYACIPYFDIILGLHGFQKEAAELRVAAARQDEARMFAAVTDEMVDALSIAGTPAECRAKLQEFAGLVELALVFSPTFRLSEDEITANHEAMLDTFQR